MSCRLVSPSPCDAALEEGSNWQIASVGRDNLKQGIRNVCNIMLEEGFNLVEIYEKQDSGFFI